MSSRRNIAARAGHWSATHRKTAIWGWIAFVVVAVVLGGMAGTNTLDDYGVGESGKADTAIEDNFPEGASETLLIEGRSGLTAEDPAFEAAVADVENRLTRVGHVEDVRGPFEQGNEGQLSENGRSALVTFEVRGEDEQVEKRIEPVLSAVEEARQANPEVTVAQFGDATADKELSQAFEDDFQKAEMTSLPVTLLILVIAFGALVAAGVPLLLGLTSVAAAIGLTSLVSHLTPMDEAANSVILLIGLAVGVDYTLFYLRREREERAAGRGERAALEAAAATSGRAVIVSGITVMIAMAGMYLAGAATFSSFATGTIIVVAIAVLGSLTVLPAILAWLGDRVDKGRVPLLARLRARRDPEKGLWAKLVRLVLRRPVVSAGLAGGLLVVLALPAFGLHTVTPGVETLPRDLSVIKAYDDIERAFPGGPAPASVVIEADHVDSRPVGAAIAELERTVAAYRDSFGKPVTTTVSPNGRVAVVDVPLAGTGTDEVSSDALSRLRETIVPATVGGVPGAEANVTGMTAGSVDFNDLMKSNAPLVFLFVLSAAFVLLMVAFRSIVIPATSIVLNLLSVGAAYGLLVWVFQDGRLEGLLGFQSIGGITAWLPLFLFVILFGLSMDYHVFILSRIREGYDRGMDTSGAIEHGLRTTAGPVTSAAIVMVAVFSIFATLSMLEFKQMGIGLAAAVLIDATIVRGILVPSTMKLLGKWNWYLPSWLEWLPEVSLDGPAPEAPAAAGRDGDSVLRPPRHGRGAEPALSGATVSRSEDQDPQIGH